MKSHFDSRFTQTVLFCTDPGLHLSVTKQIIDTYIVAEWEVCIAGYEPSFFPFLLRPKCEACWPWKKEGKIRIHNLLYGLSKRG